MRSRTGCLTCRTRKLKCDEQKPQCSQCRKGGRECRPSDGVVFRHQQNASMNKDPTEPSSNRGNLKGFYSYKNTFDEDSVWLDIPKHVVFVDNSDPYAEELEATLGESETAVRATSQTNGWGQMRTSSTSEESHGLDALSAAATNDRFPFPHLGPDHQSMSSDVPFSLVDVPASVSSGPPSSQARSAIHSASPPISVSSNNTNINFLLNPSHPISPPVDPSIQPTERRRSSFTPRSAVSGGSATDQKSDVEVETGHEGAFLLRHFAEAPGLWMDLYDLGTYFASYVPVKALTNPLLKCAACAYAAKQLGRVKGAKAPAGGVCSKQAAMETWPDAKNVDWSWYGAKYYEKAIQLLMKELQLDKGPPPSSAPEGFGQWHAQRDGTKNLHKRRRRFSNGRLSTGVHSDEVLAATAILSIYEFLDATDPAWNRHLSGVKSLLDVAEVGMTPLEQLPFPRDPAFQPPKKPGLSKARKATFWNFARQDYLAAFINETHTRLNTEDLALWTEAGLQLDNTGFVRASNKHAAGYPEGDDVMKEDLISNALVWILSKIVNFIGSGHQVHMNENGAVGTGLGVSQQALLERWYRLETELDAWYNGLPDTFRPCARIEPFRLPHHTARSGDETSLIPEIWHTIPMCGSAMQHYHMARILLLVNKPHESTGRRSTIIKRLSSYRSIENDIRYHSREILGVSLSRPDGSVRIHSLQPLFVSGQCLTDDYERRIVVRLLRGVETDLGWATEYRVNQLLREWGWGQTPDAVAVS